MQIRYTNELYYPAECSILLMRKLSDKKKVEKPLLDSPAANLAQLRELYGAGAEEVAEPLQRLAELTDYVWERSSFPPETLYRLFSQEQRGGYSIGHIFPYLMRAGVELSNLSGEERFEILRGLILTDLLGDLIQPAESLRTEAELFDFIDRCDCPEELKWSSLRLYHHAEEYESEVRAILKETEQHFREKEAPFRPLWEGVLAQIQANIEEGGLSYLRDHYHIKPDGEELLIAPSLMLFGGVSMQSSIGVKGRRGCVYMWFGFLVDELERISKEYGANGELLSRRLKVLSDKRRLEILCALRNRTLCGQELAELTGLTPATVSHHMSALLQENFVNIEREGARYNYSLSRVGVEKLIDSLHRTLL